MIQYGILKKEELIMDFKVCNGCAKECIGETPCKNCVENKLSYGDLFTLFAVIVVCYLWAIIN